MRPDEPVMIEARMARIVNMMVVAMGNVQPPATRNERSFVGLRRRNCMTHNPAMA